ncbi:ferrous iron transport protein A [Mariniblastus sp.]|nr:ferrous iron transport protein A [Mariniblastus sp.]
MIVDKNTIRLRDLAAGKVAKVISISGEPREISRIASLGLRTGEVISVSRGGITCIIQFCNGTRLCLRMSNALEIFVQEI